MDETVTAAAMSTIQAEKTRRRSRFKKESGMVMREEEYCVRDVAAWDFGIVRENISLCFNKKEAEYPECDSCLQESQMEYRSIWW